MPACTLCLLARSKKISIGTKKAIVPQKKVILYLDKYKPGYLVSVEQFVVNTCGQLLIGYIHKYCSYIFHGGTLYNDDDTSIHCVEN